MPTAKQMGKKSWAVRSKDPNITSKQSAAGKLGAKKRWENHKKTQNYAQS